MLHRAVREDVHGEPPPASVRERAVAPTVPASSSPSPVKRLRIPRIGVDAPVVEMGVGADGAMESPAGPDPVAWYGFSAKPGSAGNAVFSGHVDFHDYGPAVFWNVRKLQPSDIIEVALEDGRVLSYVVTATQQYPVATIPMAEILAPTPGATVTLITCAGTFREGNYSDLLVVRAVSTLAAQGLR
jgi:sortase (surface protein transpeptidase)